MAIFRFSSFFCVALKRLARAIKLKKAKLETSGTEIKQVSHIDGVVYGDIRANTVVIGKNAIIKGAVYADTAIVHGRIEGSLYARSVKLHSTCHVTANILQETLAIAFGAIFEGDCTYSCNAPAQSVRSIDSSTHEVLPLRLAS